MRKMQFCFQEEGPAEKTGEMSGLPQRADTGAAFFNHGEQRVLMEKGKRVRPAAFYFINSLEIVFTFSFCLPVIPGVLSRVSIFVFKLDSRLRGNDGLQNLFSGQ